MTDRIKSINARSIGPVDNPEMRERLESLERSYIFRLYRTTLETELANVRRQNDDERDTITVHQNQGKISALRLALELPTQMYRQAGGKRDLFTGTASMTQEQPGNYTAPQALPIIRFLSIVPQTGDPKYICERHGPFVIPKESLADLEDKSITVACLKCANEGSYQ